MAHKTIAQKMPSQEEVLRQIELEFSLLSDEDFCNQLSGAKLQSCMRLYLSGHLMAIPWHGGLRFPSFQIQPRRRIIRPVFRELIAIARTGHRSDAQLTLWLCQSSAALNRVRPVDKLDQPVKVVTAAQKAIDTEW